MTNKSEIDALVRAEVERQLKAAQPTPYPTDAEMAKWKDEQHQARERRASNAALTFYSPDQLAAMRAATSDADVQAIVRDQRGAPTGPASIIPGGARASNVRVSGGTGWQHLIPLRNGIGQGK